LAGTKNENEQTVGRGQSVHRTKKPHAMNGRVGGTLRKTGLKNSPKRGATLSPWGELRLEEKSVGGSR